MDSLRHWTAPDGARIAYRLWRTERSPHVLVLLHGAASNSTRWWRYVAESALRDEFNFLRIDRRGQGLSTWRGNVGPREWCDDIAAILSREGFGRAFIGGHCLGANLSVTFAARHPDRSAGLVLVEPMPTRALTGTMLMARRLRPLWHGLSGIATAANALGLHRRTLVPLDLQVLDQRAEADPAVLDEYASPLLDLRHLPVANYFRDLLAVTDPLPDLATIRVPALALVSRNSTFTDPPAALAALQELPMLDVAELDAKHWIPTEQPEQMRDAIDDWLGRQVGPAATSSR